MNLLNMQRSLLEPFPKGNVEWRIQASGKKSDGNLWALAIPYLNARDIMQRMDDVFGIGGWKNEYKEIPGSLSTEKGMFCELSAKIDGEWLTKIDLGTATEIEPLKGAVSGALKRTAVLWGVGRYMYEIAPIFVQTSSSATNGWEKAKTKEGNYFYWQKPTLPDNYLPTPKVTMATMMVVDNLLESLKDEEKAITLKKKYADYFNLDTISAMYEKEALMMVSSLEKQVTESLEAKKATPKATEKTTKSAAKKSEGEAA